MVAVLYVLIGNMMDNAIEVYQGVPQTDWKITHKLKIHNNSSFIKQPALSVRNVQKVHGEPRLGPP